MCFFQGWNSVTLFSSNKSKIKLLNLSNFWQLEQSPFIKHDGRLKIPSPLNHFDNKTGQLGGDGLQDWLYKCNQHTLQTFRVRHLDTKDLNVKSFSFISVWINWLCLKILIANFSQTIVLGGLLDMSLWRPATVCLPDEFNEVCLCGGRWPSKMTMPDKKKKSLCLRSNKITANVVPEVRRLTIGLMCNSLIFGWFEVIFPSNAVQASRQRGTNNDRLQSCLYCQQCTPYSESATPINRCKATITLKHWLTAVLSLPSDNKWY